MDHEYFFDNLLRNSSLTAQPDAEREVVTVLEALLAIVPGTTIPRLRAEMPRWLAYELRSIEDRGRRWPVADALRELEWRGPAGLRTVVLQALCDELSDAGERMLRGLLPAAIAGRLRVRPPAHASPMPRVTKAHRRPPGPSRRPAGGRSTGATPARAAAPGTIARAAGDS